MKKWLIAGTIALLGSPLWLDLSMRGILSLLPGDDGKPVDAIVILGRGEGNRAERALAAAELWHEGRSPLIFASGMTDAPILIDAVQQMGATAEQVSGERCSQSTRENALFVETLLDATTRPRILLITDKPHMMRSFLLFQGFGFEVMPHPVALEADSPWSPQRLKVLAREHGALLGYGLSSQYRAGSDNVQQAAKVGAIAKLSDWNCGLQVSE